MFGSVGGTELLVILLLGLLVFGPRRLPEIGRTIGKALAEFRRATQDLKESIEREVDLKEADIRGELDEIKRIAPSPRSLLAPTIPVPPDDKPAAGSSPGSGGSPASGASPASPLAPNDDRTPRS